MLLRRNYNNSEQIFKHTENICLLFPPTLMKIFENCNTFHDYSESNNIHTKYKKFLGGNTFMFSSKHEN